jgi:hypothetical protein
LLAAVPIAFVLLRGLASSERRAKFVQAVNDLREADMDLQREGTFTNHFRHTHITALSNGLALSGTNYHCEFIAVNEDFRDFGVLAITTNQIVIWIDKKQQVFPVFSRDTPFRFPPGF